VRLLSRRSKVEVLGEVPLFSRCSQRELNHIAAVATELSLAADDRLTTEGERGREFFVLLDGAAAVRRKGRRIGTLGTGDVVGEIALVADVPRTATVTTEAPTRVLVIADYDFRRLLLESPSMTFKITQALAERLAMDAGMKRRPIV
jgi:CRP-like cAMP-binding protein